MNRIVKTLSRVAFAAFVTVAIVNATQRAPAQALTMDGQSGTFFQPWANVVPSSPGKFNGPTLSYHAVTAGPVAGDYFNVSVEEGFGNWLEFGCTRDNHTDGGNPTLIPLFNDAGMNIFNIKAKVLPENFHKQKWIPAVAVGGALRTNDPYVSQASALTNTTNGDIYGVATKLVVIEKKFPLLLLVRRDSTSLPITGSPSMFSKK
jgi:hypothetical protein